MDKLLLRTGGAIIQQRDLVLADHTRFGRELSNDAAVRGRIGHWGMVGPSFEVCMILISALVITAWKRNCTLRFAGDRPTSEALIVLRKIVIDGIPIGL